MRNIFHTYIARLILSAITFITNVIIARKLGSSGMGDYALMLASSMLLAQMLSFGLDTSLLYHSSKNSQNSGKYVKLAIVYSFSISLVLLFVFFLLEHFGAFIVEHSLLIILLMMCQMLQSLLIAIKTGEGNLFLVNKYLIFCHSILLIFIGVILPEEHHHYLSLITAYIVTSLSLIFLLSKEINWFDKGVPRLQLPNLFKYAAQSYVASISGVIRLRIQIIILSLYVLPSAIGLYSVAQSFTETFYILPIVLSSMLVPIIANLSHQQRAETFVNYTKVAFYTGIFMLLAIQLLSPMIIPLLYGETYQPVINILNILSISIVFYCLNKMLMGLLYALEKPSLCSKSEFLAMCMAIICSLILAPEYGVKGIAISAVFSSITLSIILTYYVKQHSEVKIINIFKVTKKDLADLAHNVSSYKRNNG